MIAHRHITKIIAVVMAVLRRGILQPWAYAFAQLRFPLRSRRRRTVWAFPWSMNRRCLIPAAS